MREENDYVCTLCVIKLVCYAHINTIYNTDNTIKASKSHTVTNCFHTIDATRCSQGNQFSYYCRGL